MNIAGWRERFCKASMESAGLSRQGLRRQYPCYLPMPNSSIFPLRSLFHAGNPCRRALYDSVDVVVNTEELTEAQRAQIEDIVIRKTGVSADSIIISTVDAN